MTASLWALGAAVAIGIALWLVSLAIRNSSIVDIAWGPLFLLIGVVARGAADGARGQLVLVLLGVWALRLALHLLWRNGVRHEDRRYVTLRERFGARYWLVSLPLVFLLQPTLAWIVALPVQAAVLRPGPPLGWLDGVATLLVVAGTIVESTADLQLARFRARGSAGVLDNGLWRYSRHPNYFGDFVVWWGFGAFGAAAGAPWALVGPLVMSYLLLRVSGVTLLEKTIGSRRPDYEAYRRRTNAFFPGPPRPTEPPNG